MKKEEIQEEIKIKGAMELISVARDYIELLKVAPKLKEAFNTEVINEQITLNEKEILRNAERLQG